MQGRPGRALTHEGVNHKALSQKVLGFLFLTCNIIQWYFAHIKERRPVVCDAEFKWHKDVQSHTYDKQHGTLTHPDF
jgi:hypothetical protein